MDFRTLDSQRKKHPAWRLLRAENAPLIASFLYQSFVSPNIRTLSQSDLISRLEDTLYRLRQEYGDDEFPKAAQSYLEDWAADSHGWLRKYYPSQGDEAQ